jgi:hypothetical protein
MVSWTTYCDCYTTAWHDWTYLCQTYFKPLRHMMQMKLTFSEFSEQFQWRHCLHCMHWTHRVSHLSWENKPPQNMHSLLSLLSSAELIGTGSSDSDFELLDKIFRDLDFVLLHDLIVAVFLIDSDFCWRSGMTSSHFTYSFILFSSVDSFVVGLDLEFFNLFYTGNRSQEVLHHAVVC